MSALNERKFFPQTPIYRTSILTKIMDASKIPNRDIHQEIYPSNVFIWLSRLPGRVSPKEWCHKRLCCISLHPFSDVMSGESTGRRKELKYDVNDGHSCGIGITQIKITRLWELYTEKLYPLSGQTDAQTEKFKHNTAAEGVDYLWVTSSNVTVRT